jgi:hypothetical protein
MNGIRAGSDNTSSVTLTDGHLVPGEGQAVTHDDSPLVAQDFHSVKHADRARLRGQRKARGPQKVRGSFLTVGGR